jgi:hypothetical protein
MRVQGDTRTSNLLQGGVCWTRRKMLTRAAWGRTPRGQGTLTQGFPFKTSSVVIPRQWLSAGAIRTLLRCGQAIPMPIAATRCDKECALLSWVCGVCQM